MKRARLSSVVQIGQEPGTRIRVRGATKSGRLVRVLPSPPRPSTRKTQVGKDPTARSIAPERRQKPLPAPLPSRAAALARVGPPKPAVIRGVGAGDTSPSCQTVESPQGRARVARPKPSARAMAGVLARPRSSAIKTPVLKGAAPSSLSRDRPTGEGVRGARAIGARSQVTRRDIGPK